MSVGMIARMDAGGLGSICREVFRHLQPERTLLLDLGENGRGSCAESAYDVEGSRQSVYRCDWAGGLPARAIEWLTAPGIETIYSAEVLYDDRILTAARANGIRVVVHAMPELAPWATTAITQLAPSTPRPEIVLPTSWRADTLPGARVLPVPVATDRLPYRARTKVEHLYHPTGAAMLDRNGTNLFLRALPLIDRPLQVTIRSERPLTLPPCPHDITVVSDPVENYWEQYPDADLLVLPRRYGGLCLPVQECAALGMPSVLMTTDPYYEECTFAHGLPTTREQPGRMKGGTVPVFDADPRALAATIAELVGRPEHIAEFSSRAGRWASENSWFGPLGDEWCSTLNADCEWRNAA